VNTAHDITRINSYELIRVSVSALQDAYWKQIGASNCRHQKLQINQNLTITVILGTQEAVGRLDVTTTSFLISITVPHHNNGTAK